MIRSISTAQILERHGLDYFKDASTLGALSEEALLYLLEKGEVLELDVGDRLFSYGDQVDCFYVILDGRVGFYKPCKGSWTHIRDYSFGMELGFVAMIGLHSRTGSADAEDSSHLLKVTSTLFSDLQQDLPNDFGVLLLNLSREMARRLRDADNRLAEMEQK